MPSPSSWSSCVPRRRLFLPPSTTWSKTSRSTTAHCDDRKRQIRHADPRSTIRVRRRRATARYTGIPTPSAPPPRGRPTVRRYPIGRGRRTMDDRAYPRALTVSTSSDMRRILSHAMCASSMALLSFPSNAGSRRRGLRERYMLPRRYHFRRRIVPFTIRPPSIAVAVPRVRDRWRARENRRGDDGSHRPSPMPSSSSRRQLPSPPPPPRRCRLSGLQT